MKPLLEATGVSKKFPLRGRHRAQGVLLAVQGVDLAIGRGECVALVGESGSGKSTLGRCLLHLDPPSSGVVRFDGVELASLPPHSLRALRRRFQPVFQDPLAALDPRVQVGKAVAEPAIAHRLIGRSEASRLAASLLERVELSSDVASRLPHQLSGGQRQRVSIARALATQPDLLVADEPVSALDSSIRAQVLNLIANLQAERELALLFISHDLALVEQIADRIAVMFAGRIVESAPTESLFVSPAHPYTRELLAAVPRIEGGGSAERWMARMSTPSARPEESGGCPFQPRCPIAAPACGSAPPALAEVGAGHLAACYFPDSMERG